MLYFDKKKKITKELLNYFTESTIAFLYFDDGSMVKDGKNYYSYKIATYSFDNESLCNLRSFMLERFNIKTTVRSDNTLYIRAESKNIFKSILLKNYIECMDYKINP